MRVATVVRSGLRSAIVMLLALPCVAHAAWTLNLTKGVTPYSETVYRLHMGVMLVCCVIGVVVFGAMFYSMIMFRKSRGAVAATWSHSTTAEIVWTVLPILILIGMAIPATKALIMMEDTANAAMTIKVTGYQWRWGYEYIEDEVKIISGLAQTSNAARALNSDINPADVPNYLLEVDHHIVIPTDTKIRFLTTAADVIHAWWVPDLGWKRDAIPGFINESWALVQQPGIYRGQCTELCGKDHGFMPIVVEAVSPERYREWVAEQKALQVSIAALDVRNWTREELLARGSAVYAGTCAACHQADGRGITGSFPDLRNSAVNRGPLAEHLALVMNGRPGTVMTGYFEQLSNADIAAVITWTRQTWGADTAIVQPTDVAAARLARTAVASSR